MKQDYAIVPVREFSMTKLRLSSVLSTEQRSALSRALLSRVIRALTLSRISKIILVSSDPSEVLSSFRIPSKLTAISESTHHGGVNRAMRDGIDLARKEDARTITLLPSDLPVINHSKINEALDLLTSLDLIINPSLEKDGTNLLAFVSDIDFHLYYDDNSYSKHCREAVIRQLKFRQLDWKEFSTDLDTEDDLKRTMKLYSVFNFEELIAKIEHAAV
jgi:2-phospho-L-lactate guanylyltransferase